MTSPEKLFHDSASSIKNAEASQMFGKPCYKVNGKAFVCFFNGDMVFKLANPAHADAMKLKDAKLFDPSGTGRAMKEWVQLSAVQSKQWPAFAMAAFDYVKG